MNTLNKYDLSGTSQVRTYGKPAVGGPFSLVDEDGRPVTDASYPGKYLLIYFGFTYCPDICPSELVKIGKVLQKLGTRERERERETSLLRALSLGCTISVMCPVVITDSHFASYPESSYGIKDQIQPLFISLDGKRDSIAQMKQYKKGEQYHNYMCCHSSCSLIK